MPKKTDKTKKFPHLPVKVKSTPTKTTTQTKKKPVVPQSSSPHSKTNTLAYYNCLIDQVASPSNDKVKITQLSHHCKCSKEKVAVAQAQHKKKLIQQLAQNYKNFGESLGHYLHADIIGCAKNLKKK